jgi:hypothetical protein
MRRPPHLLLLFGLAAFVPGNSGAQVDGPSATWDAMFGWQRSLAPLQDEAWDVRRTTRFSLGLARTLRSDREVSWRLGAELTPGSLVVKRKGARDGHSSDLTEYAAYVDVAPSLFRSLSGFRAAELRGYVGAGWRWMQRGAFLCTLGEECYQALEYNERRPDPVGRLGLLASYRRAGFMTRLDAGYRISSAWSVVQHDVALGLALVLVVPSPS